MEESLYPREPSPGTTNLYIREVVIAETLQYNTVRCGFLFCPTKLRVENWNPGCVSLRWDSSQFSALLGVSNCVEDVCISLESTVVSQLLLTDILCPTSQVLRNSTGDNQQRRWKEQINCPTRSGLPLIAGSCHCPSCLIGVYKGHMA